MHKSVPRLILSIIFLQVQCFIRTIYGCIGQCIRTHGIIPFFPLVCFGCFLTNNALLLLFCIVVCVYTMYAAYVHKDKNVINYYYY